MALALKRMRALGDVVLLGAVTKTIGDCTVVTEPRYAPVARELIGVRHVRTSGRGIDMAKISKHSLQRRLHAWLQAAPRPTVPELYAAHLGVRPAPLPWIRGHHSAGILSLLPGASTALKRPDLATLRRAGRAWNGPVHVLAGPGEEALADALGRPDGWTVLCETGFSGTLATLRASEQAIGGDTGLLHLAGALGVTVHGLFGPTAPTDGFFVYAGEAHSRHLPCSPCTFHRGTTCRIGGTPCKYGLL